MHIFLIIAAVAILSWSSIDLKVQMLLEAFMILLCIPDLILIFRKSPPFIPSMKRDVRRMMALARVQEGDLVIDPGCGDGRLVFAAADLGAQAIGYEMVIPAWALAKVRSLFHPRSSIVYGDFWTKDYTQADVVFCYLLSDMMETFHEKIWPQLKPGCRVVSNSFSMKKESAIETDRGVRLYIKK